MCRMKKISTFLIECSYFNLEVRKQIVRIVNPKGKIHKNNTNLLCFFITANTTFKELYNEDVKHILKTLKRNIENIYLKY